jgi:hypothetical protein
MKTVPYTSAHGLVLDALYRNAEGVEARPQAIAPNCCVVCDGERVFTPAEFLEQFDYVSGPDG